MFLEMIQRHIDEKDEHHAEDAHLRQLAQREFGVPSERILLTFDVAPQWPELAIHEAARLKWPMSKDVQYPWR